VHASHVRFRGGRRTLLLLLMALVAVAIEAEGEEISRGSGLRRFGGRAGADRGGGDLRRMPLLRNGR
jgi:hypothetical protein